MNMQEDYVSFETAKLLKEKGFDGECLAIYYPDSRLETFDSAFNYNIPGGTSGVISAPTLQMVMKWLREIYRLDIDISIEYIPKKVYYYAILKKTAIRDIDCLHSETNFKSHEQACEAAIKYCLENLI